MKIADLQVGANFNATLVVIGVTQRETKKLKPYLSLEFFDGIDKVSGNYWDWNGMATPVKNDIVDVRGQVTEWQGTKQLNVKGMSLNKEAHISDFMPQSGIDVAAAYNEAYALTLKLISDDEVRTLTLYMLDTLRDKLLQAPGARSIHHAYVGGALVHSLSVAKLAYAIAKETPGANSDLCFAGGMLHDIGKVVTYKLDGLVIEMTDEGMLFEHLHMGAEMLHNASYEALGIDYGTTLDKVTILRHILLSHHGALEHGAVVNPLCIEAHIVHHADMLDAVSEMVREASRKAPRDAKWTDKIYALNNRPHLTTTFVDKVMARPIDAPF